PLAADEGTVMHAFLAPESADGEAFRLRLIHSDPSRFEFALPAGVSGRYHVLAEVTDTVGFLQTLSTTITLSRNPAQRTRREATEARDGMLLLRSNGEWMYIRPWGNVSAAAVRHFAPQQNLSLSEAAGFPRPPSAAGDRIWLV